MLEAHTLTLRIERDISSQHIYRETVMELVSHVNTLSLNVCLSVPTTEFLTFKLNGTTMR